MSLDFKLTAIKDYETKCWNEDGTMKGVTQCIILMTPAIGIGTLTEQTLPEFAARIEMYQRIDGPLLNGPDGPMLLTVEHLRDHIGLGTNVFPMETRAKWIKRIVSREMDAISDRVEAELHARYSEAAKVATAACARRSGRES